MYARWIPNFFGKAWYSNITIQGEGKTTLYGQLQFLDKAQFSSCLHLHYWHKKEIKFHWLCFIVCPHQELSKLLWLITLYCIKQTTMKKVFGLAIEDSRKFNPWFYNNLYNRGQRQCSLALWKMYTNCTIDCINPNFTIYKFKFILSSLW